MKKILKRTGIALIGIILICAVTATVLFWSELRSLSSIKKVDNYGMFQMTYYGDYGFDDFQLQWTVIYNVSALDGVIFANRNTDRLIDFQLSPRL